MESNKKNQLLGAMIAIIGGLVAIFAGFYLTNNSSDDADQPAQIQEEQQEPSSQSALDSKISTILDEFNDLGAVSPNEEIVYIVKDSQIQNQDIEPTDQIIWDIFSKIAVNKDLLNSITEIRIFGETSQDLEGTLAFVEQISTTEEEWSLGVNYDELNDEREMVATLIHEYMHIESLQDSYVISVDEDPQAISSCTTLVTAEGCNTADSILNKWHEAHWKSNNLSFTEEDSEETTSARFEANQELFINDYAATNTIEDFAESFAHWSINDPTVPVAKQQYLNNQPELVKIKEQIRSALISD